MIHRNTAKLVSQNGDKQIYHVIQTILTRWCMCISARDDSLPGHLCRPVICIPPPWRNRPLPSHWQLVAGLWRISWGAQFFLFEKRSSSHSLKALAAVFGLSSFGFEEYLKEIRYRINNSNILIYAQSLFVLKITLALWGVVIVTFFSSSLVTSVFSSPLGCVDLQKKG